MKFLQMVALEEEIVEQEIINILEKACKKHNIGEEVNAAFRPGNFLMSIVLVSITSEIEMNLGISIPVDKYIFHDDLKNREQLSIKGAVKKLLKVAKNER